MVRLISGFAGWWEDILSFVFPPRRLCFFCGAAVSGEEICDGCLQVIAEFGLKFRCFICGRFHQGDNCNLAPMGWEEREKGVVICPECIERERYFTLARSVGPYDDILRKAIWRFKFGNQRDLARPLGILLSEVVRNLKVLCESGKAGRKSEVAGLVPVPLARSRLLERGFNQSELLARQVSIVLGLPLLPVLSKVKETLPQTGLLRKQRQSNLTDAFCVARSVIPVEKSVILIDDVFTTGCTASECARTLLAADVGQVYVATVASAVERTIWR